MAGTDFNIHDGTPRGVMRELCNAFVRQQNRPTVPRMMKQFETVSRLLPRMMAENGSRTLFEARAFDDLVALAAYTR